MNRLEFDLLEVGDMILVENTCSNSNEYPHVWRKITSINQDEKMVEVDGGGAGYEDWEIIETKSKYDYNY